MVVVELLAPSVAVILKIATAVEMGVTKIAHTPTTVIKAVPQWEIVDTTVVTTVTVNVLSVMNYENCN